MKKTNKKTSLVLLVTLTLILIVVVLLIIAGTKSKLKFQAAVNPSVTMSLDPTALSVTPGSTFNVNVKINSAGVLTFGSEFFIKFNPTYLEVQDSDAAAAGVQIKAGSLYTTLINNAADNTKGEITYSHAIDPGSTGIAVNGVLATITFKAKQVVASTPVTFNFIAGSEADNTNVSEYPSTNEILGSVTNANYSIVINPPSPPSNITITPSFGKIRLTWSAATPGSYPVGGYYIYRAQTPGGQTSTPLASVPAAQLSYDDTAVINGTTYYYKLKTFDNQSPPTLSAFSNEYSATPKNATLSFALKWPKRTNHSISNATIKIFPQGTSTPVFTNSSVNTDSSGSGTVVLTAVGSGTYDVTIRPHYCIGIKKTNIAITSETVNIDFGEAIAGNLNDDSGINGADFSIMKTVWLTSDPVGDITGDGTVNLMDFSIMSLNWFKADP